MHKQQDSVIVQNIVKPVTSTTEGQSDNEEDLQGKTV